MSGDPACTCQRARLIRCPGCSDRALDACPVHGPARRERAKKWIAMQASRAAGSFSETETHDG